MSSEEAKTCKHDKGLQLQALSSHANAKLSKFTGPILWASGKQIVQEGSVGTSAVEPLSLSRPL